MSSTALGWALDARRTGDLPDGARLVLLVLADHASSDGEHAWPSKATIGARINMQPRTVARHLSLLRDRGLIAEGDQRLVSHVPHYLRPTVYDLALSDPMSEVTPGGNSGQTPCQSVSSPRVSTDTQTKNLNQLHKPPSVGSRSLSVVRDPEQDLEVGPIPADVDWRAGLEAARTKGAS